jgi:surfeit locus 1 family protein
MNQRFSSQAMFSAHWWLMLAVTLLVTALTARLGLWQLDRAAQKEQAHARVLAQGQLPPLLSKDFLQTLQPTDGLERRVDLEGEWLSQWTVYLENRTMQGRPGFWVFTPLQLYPDRVVLVQRGWVARDLVQSDKLPAIETPQGLAKVQGRWIAPPSAMVELSQSQQASAKQGFQALRQNIDMKALAQESGLVFVANVLQTGEPSEGLMRDWPAHLSGADKNRAYALQWFALALLCVGLFTWFQIIQKIKHEAH